MKVFTNRSRVLQISLYTILSAFVVELAAGLIYNSLGLITDSVHALLDSMVTAVLLLAARMAAKPPDAEHPYGHGKIESLGGLFGGIAILLMAAFFIFESINRIQGPPPDLLFGAPALAAGAYTMCVSIFRIIMLRRSIASIGGTTLRADFYHAFMDLGSTTVAVMGIILVAYGVYHGDFVAALILGLLLAVLSIKLIRSSALDLVDTISPSMVSRVREIALDTPGVTGVGPVLLRRSGETIFADIVIALRGDTSFDKAHKISETAEGNIKLQIPNSSITIHFEPTWEQVPADSAVGEIACTIPGVRDVHNISSYSSEGRTYVSLHVMVDRRVSLEDAHEISDAIEARIRERIPDVEHATIHLEPYTDVRRAMSTAGKSTEGAIRDILDEYASIKNVGRVVIFNNGDLLKIDIDCSLDRSISIERAHDLVSDAERRIRASFRGAIVTIHTEPA